MSQFLRRLHTLRPRHKRSWYIPAAVLILFAVIGTVLLYTGRAATPPLIMEPEAGTVTGGATPADDQAASGGRAVKFGSGTLPAPTGLRVITGGNNAAVMWQPVANTSASLSYAVFRNGVQIGTSRLASTGPTIYRISGRYTDTAVSPRATYSYQVQAIEDDTGLKSALSAPFAVTIPANTTPVPAITVDTAAAPDLANWLNNTALPEIRTWYPKISDALAYPAYMPRSDIKIIVRDDPSLVANATFSTGVIQLGAQWARAHPEDTGLFIHEITHIIEAYGTNRPPNWITEGIADWTREYLYMDRLPTKPSGYNTYTQGYSQASYFLEYIKDPNSPTFIRDLNVAAHNGTYTSAYIANKTGKSADQHWSEITGRSIVTAHIKARQSNHCVDDLDYSRTNGTKIQVWTCSAPDDAQLWSQFTHSNGSVSLVAFGKCMDVTGSGTADGTRVQLWDCSNSSAQQWRMSSNGTIVNTNSNKCLYNSGGATNGTWLVIWTCNAADPNQLWTYPYNM